MAREKIILDIQAEVRKAKKDIASLQKGVSNVNKEVQKSESVFNKAALAFSSLFSVAAVVGFTKRIIEVRSEFEKYEAVLSNSLGSMRAANVEMQRLTKFASTTPFQLNELTSAFVKMVNQGFKPTSAELRKLGDVAASTGKSFDQLTEAIIDATVGEFERLKEFGIRAQKAGDTVKFTFKEVETQVKFTSDSIRDYILSLGDLEGVSGSMEKISETLGGRISNLKDEFDLLFNALGEANSGVLKESVGLLARLVRSMREATEVKTVFAAAPGGAAGGVAITDFFVRLFGGKGIKGRLDEIAEQSLEEFEETVVETNKKVKAISDKEFDKLLKSIRAETPEGEDEGSAIEQWMFGFDFDVTNQRIQDNFKEIADGLAKQRELSNNEQDLLRLEQLEKAEKQNQTEIELAKFLRDQKLQLATEVFRTGARLAKEGTALQKTLAIAEVTISGVTATQKAYEWGMESGGPVVAGLAAAAAAIVGILNLALVSGVTFAEGGYTGKSKLPAHLSDKHGRIAGLVHEDEFVFNRDKTAKLRPLFEDIHNDRIDARGLAALTRRGVIVPMVNNNFNSKILENEVSKIYQQIRSKDPERYIERTERGYIKKTGNTTIIAN